MDNAKLIVHVLLVTAALSTAAHHARTSTHKHHAATSATSEHRSRRVARHSSVKKRRISSEPIYTVTATAYQAVAEQTDKNPFVTADNSRIKPHYSSKIRWMALSQDLLAPWGGKFNYGDKVRVRGLSPKLDGVYTVHDTMNKRHRHCMDVLTHPSERFDIFTKGVKIQLAKASSREAHEQKPKRSYALASPLLRSSAGLARQRARHGTKGHKKPPYYFASAIL